LEHPAATEWKADSGAFPSGNPAFL
jgi:hypothetical protein